MPIKCVNNSYNHFKPATHKTNTTAKDNINDKPYPKPEISEYFIASQPLLNRATKNKILVELLIRILENKTQPQIIKECKYELILIGLIFEANINCQKITEALRYTIKDSNAAISLKHINNVIILTSLNSCPKPHITRSISKYTKVLIDIISVLENKDKDIINSDVLDDYYEEFNFGIDIQSLKERLNFILERKPNYHQNVKVKIEKNELFIQLGNATGSMGNYYQLIFSIIENFNSKIQLKIDSLKKQNRKITAFSNNSISYISKGGNPDINLNCKILNNLKRRIVCADFSFEFLVLLSSNENYHDRFNSKEEIQKNSSLMDSIYNKFNIEDRADEYHLFDLKKIGKCLYKLIENMSPGSLKMLNLHIQQHLMSIAVKQKNHGIVILSYDPNITDTHIRIFFINKIEIKNLEFRQLLQKPELAKEYASIYKSGILLVYNNPEKPGPIKVSKSINNIFLKYDLSGNLFYQLWYGGGSIISALKKVFSLNISKYDKFRLLRNIVAEDGNHIFHRTVLKGYIGTAIAYIEAILNSDLDEAQKIYLIEAEDRKGYNTISKILLLSPLPRLLSSYINLIINSNLTPRAVPLKK